MGKNSVEEIQGLYGPFILSERVVQKIWLRGDFDQKELLCSSGRALRILDPGRWNHLEGPDFLDARLEIGGDEVVGDVEVHFKAEDWFAHAHELNPNFNRVCLHVVLHPDVSREVVTTVSGSCPETLCLMPLLERDLEDYMIDDALIEMEQVQDIDWLCDFVKLSVEERWSRLRKGAQQRWSKKVLFAEKRLSKVPWEVACHQYCMEVLGYARNRAPMARLSMEYLIADFACGRADPEVLFNQEAERWRLNGLRPANHPKNRLAQYAQLCREYPDWPERALGFLRRLEEGDESLSVSCFRRTYGVNRLCSSIAKDVFSDCIRAKRLNTVICDALLPLASAAGVAGLNPYWFSWPVGDAPDQLCRAFKQAELISREDPYANGHVQGGLHLVLKG